MDKKTKRKIKRFFKKFKKKDFLIKFIVIISSLALLITSILPYLL